MKISELAKLSGLSVHTLRYYEKNGLLKPKRERDNNYRYYDQDDLTTALFIQRCKASGFSLQETASLLEIKDNKSEHVCAQAKGITQQKLKQIEKQISELKQMQKTLKALEAHCCGGQESAEFCSIINSLEQGE